MISRVRNFCRVIGYLSLARHRLTEPYISILSIHNRANLNRVVIGKCSVICNFYQKRSLSLSYRRKGNILLPKGNHEKDEEALLWQCKI